MTNGSLKKILQPILIRNGTVIDPFSGNVSVKDILIINGIVSDLSVKRDELSNCEVIDADSLCVTHGFFDMHVHLREPGGEAAETFETGADSALAGGVTSLLAMANTNPCVDNLDLFLEIRENTKDLPVNIFQLPAVTIGREGKSLTDMCGLSKAGAVAFTDDGSGIGSSQIMKDAFRLSKELGKLISIHAEDHSFAHGVMNESALSNELGLPGLPYATETINIARDIELAKYLDCSVHFQHISSKHSVDLIRKAKNDGIKVSCEAAPHHYSLTEEKVRTLSPNYKMNPPLRKAEDVEAILEGLKDGTVDVIATDHAPHTKEKKDLGFLKAPFGVTGLETLLSSGITYLVRPGHLSLMEFIKKITIQPRKLIGFETDLFKPGAPAEITIFDPNLEWKVDGNSMLTKSSNTCYQGETHYGKVLYTISKVRIYKA
jgi:dihydroorotase